MISCNPCLFKSNQSIYNIFSAVPPMVENTFTICTYHNVVHTAIRTASIVNVKPHTNSTWIILEAAGNLVIEKADETYIVITHTTTNSV